MLLSLVVPIYNEQENLIDNINFHIKAIKSNLKNDYEIILVNDGSSDSTKKILNQIKKNNIKIIHLKKNLGVGYALQKGFEKAKGEFIMHNSCDLAYRYENFITIIKILKKYDVIIFSRISRKANSIWRITTSLGWNFIVRFILGIDFKDLNFIQIYKKEFIKSQKNVTFQPASFTTELIYSAYKKKMKIKTIKANFHKRDFNDSKYGKLSDITRSFLALIKIRKHYDN
jgi:glycosyltransferase involved in cell wall biosynthesis